MISVVIPVYNRASTVRRAVQSVLGQTVVDLEVIVIDDASSDSSAEVVRSIDDDRVRCIVLSENSGGAAARNMGILASSGDCIAFLDSDDEWLPEHLEESLGFLDECSADGVFSSFLVKRGEKASPYLCEVRDEMTPMAEYILSSHKGDARTSTFVFRRDAIRAIMFDAELHKHQDWDLAIRFSDRFLMLPRSRPTVVIHLDAINRMSSSVNHQGSERFLDRHLHQVTDTTKARIFANLAYRTFQVEGRSSRFHMYLANALRLLYGASYIDKITIMALKLPLLDHLYVSIRVAGVHVKRFLKR